MRKNLVWSLFFLGLRLLKKIKIMKFVLYGLELITQRRNFSLIKMVERLLLFCYLMFLLYWYMSDIGVCDPYINSSIGL